MGRQVRFNFFFLYNFKWCTLDMRLIDHLILIRFYCLPTTADRLVTRVMDTYFPDLNRWRCLPQRSFFHRYTPFRLRSIYPRGGIARVLLDASSPTTEKIVLFTSSLISLHDLSLCAVATPATATFDDNSDYNSPYNGLIILACAHAVRAECLSRHRFSHSRSRNAEGIVHGWQQLSVICR